MQALISSRLSALGAARRARLNELALSFIGFLLLFACSQITIPIQPVPITLQTLAIMVIGLTFTTRAGLGSIALYLGSAAIGLPVLTNWSGGLAKFAGPTAGYLVGFVVAIALMTSIRRRWPKPTFFATLSNCILGTTVIYMFGVGWLSYLVGIEPALHLGLLPFIIPGVIKSLLLCSALRFLRKQQES